MEFRKHFDYDVVAASREADVNGGDYGDSLTVQSQKDDADINVMLRRFGVTSDASNAQLAVVGQTLTVRGVEFGNFEGVKDYQSALHAVMDAEDAFMTLTADVRAKFDNDPGKFLSFAVDPANLPAMREMGLAVKEVSNVGSGQGAVGGSPASGGASGGGVGGNAASA